jgi:hypothetical protein
LTKVLLISFSAKVIFGIELIVQVGHVGSTGHVVHGVGSVDGPVTGAPTGGVPVTVAKL